MQCRDAGVVSTYTIAGTLLLENYEAMYVLWFSHECQHVVVDREASERVGDERSETIY